MKYLPYYHKWMESKQLTGVSDSDVSGLCCTPIANSELFKLIEPDIFYNAFWARGGAQYAGGKFSPLRQTFVLLLAAMNNEL